MCRKIIENRFCEIYSNFFGEKISKVKQLVNQELNGEELLDFCEFYYKQKLDESSLQHFYSFRKRKYIFIGVCIGVILCVIF